VCLLLAFYQQINSLDLRSDPIENFANVREHPMHASLGTGLPTTIFLQTKVQS